MSEEAKVVVQHRDRAEIARVASLYRASGLGFSEFCRRHGMALSTLKRHLQKQFQDVDHPDNDGVRRSPLVEVKLAASNLMRSVDRRCSLTLLLSNGRRVEVDDGFNEETLRRMIAVVERF
jgi:hypothetical protein